jgi:hypothetical protein
LLVAAVEAAVKEEAAAELVAIERLKLQTTVILLPLYVELVVIPYLLLQQVFQLQLVMAVVVDHHLVMVLRVIIQFFQQKHPQVVVLVAEVVDSLQVMREEPEDPEVVVAEEPNLVDQEIKEVLVLQKVMMEVPQDLLHPHNLILVEVVEEPHRQEQMELVVMLETVVMVQPHQLTHQQ